MALDFALLAHIASRSRKAAIEGIRAWGLALPATLATLAVLPTVVSSRAIWLTLGAWVVLWGLHGYGRYRIRKLTASLGYLLVGRVLEKELTTRGQRRADSLAFPIELEVHYRMPLEGSSSVPVAVPSETATESEADASATLRRLALAMPRCAPYRRWVWLDSRLVPHVAEGKGVLIILLGDERVCGLVVEDVVLVPTRAERENWGAHVRHV